MSEKQQSKTGIKLLILGTAASGKTTLLETLEEALVFSYDNKAFPLQNIFYRDMFLKQYGGTIKTGDDFIKRADELLVKYNEVNNKKPKTFVIDSISTVCGSIDNYCTTTYSNFDIWTQYKNNIDKINSYLTKVTLNDINVVMVSHVSYDPKTDKWEDTTKGSFAKTGGGFISTVDYSLFVEPLKDTLSEKEKKINNKAVNTNDRIIYIKNAYKLARTTLKDLKEEEEIVHSKDFSLQKYIEKVRNSLTSANKFAI